MKPTTEEQLELVRSLLQEWMIRLEIETALGPVPGEPVVSHDPEVRRWVDWIAAQPGLTKADKRQAKSGRKK